MNIETIATVGLVFVAATAARIIYEREMDVLHGPYIEGHSHFRDVSATSNPVHALADRLRWRMRGIIYLASLAE